MSDDPRGRAVPSSRLARLGSFGRILGGVAGGVVAEGARRVASGERPKLGDLVLTPANVTRVADQLAHLRGAAMKMGQMISMDAGDMLPPELTAILARLRENAHHMPPAPARQGADRRMGPRLATAVPPFSGAPDRRRLDRPGPSRDPARRARCWRSRCNIPACVDSIDADVDNVATLLRVSGLMPTELDIAPLLAEAKRQLHEEADYVREGAQLARYRRPARRRCRPIVVPGLVRRAHHPARAGDGALSEGVPIEALVDAPQETRDAAARALVTLVLRELFEFERDADRPQFRQLSLAAGERAAGPARFRRARAMSLPQTAPAIARC